MRYHFLYKIFAVHNNGNWEVDEFIKCHLNGTHHRLNDKTRISNGINKYTRILKPRNKDEYLRQRQCKSLWNERSAMIQQIQSYGVLQLAITCLQSNVSHTFKLNRSACVSTRRTANVCVVCVHKRSKLWIGRTHDHRTFFENVDQTQTDRTTYSACRTFAAAKLRTVYVFSP